MEQYLPKSVVLAEIERILDNSEEVHNNQYILLCNHFKHFLNTLEVKEVDLDKEIKKYSMELAMKENNGDWLKDVITTAKHFFELGMAVNNKAQKGEL